MRRRARRTVDAATAATPQKRRLRTWASIADALASPTSLVAIGAAQKVADDRAKRSREVFQASAADIGASPQLAIQDQEDLSAGVAGYIALTARRPERGSGRGAHTVDASHSRTDRADVERPGQLDYLRAERVDQVRGFLPLPWARPHGWCGRGFPPPVHNLSSRMAIAINAEPAMTPRMTSLVNSATTTPMAMPMPATVS